jgi:hypothetical protein
MPQIVIATIWKPQPIISKRKEFLINILYNKKPLTRKTQKIYFLVKCPLSLALQKTTNGTNKQGWYFKTFQELPMEFINIVE